MGSEWRHTGPLSCSIVSDSLADFSHCPHLVLDAGSLHAAVVNRTINGRPLAPTVETHTQIRLCGAVLVGGGSDRHFCLTRPSTRSILLYSDSSRISYEPLSTGASPCRASKPRL